MKRIFPVVASIFALAVACQSSKPAPDAPEAPERPPQEAASAAEATAQDEPDGQDSPTITYHFKDGITRAYLPLTSALCQNDADAEPLYEIVALWHFDAKAERWASIDVAPGVRYRLACNAMLDLIKILGFDLDPGTYAIAAEVNGSPERNVFYNGEMSCNDIDLGPAPDGHAALCIVGESSAEARFVPDPAELDL